MDFKNNQLIVEIIYPTTRMLLNCSMIMYWIKKIFRALFNFFNHFQLFATGLCLGLSVLWSIDMILGNKDLISKDLVCLTRDLMTARETVKRFVHLYHHIFFTCLKTLIISGRIINHSVWNSKKQNLFSYYTSEMSCRVQRRIDKKNFIYSETISNF